jgi:phosphoribosylanthranilate isomerase
MRSRRTRVKICGITRVEDALAACAAGADAIGLVFYAGSPRAVSIATAAEICRELPPFVNAVGLFVNATAAEIDAVLREVPLALLQLHGDETPAACAQLRHPYLKALRMRADTDVDTDVMAELARYPDARALLLDTYSPDAWGGTGKTFDWTRIPAAVRGRIILAGGLNPDNVADAVVQVRPYAVDVSGGVEAAPGIKDAQRIESFLAAVTRADHVEQSSD